MHRGCLVWMRTPPLTGRRTPHPGPVHVCVCSSVLAGSGGPASGARSGAPHIFLWPLCLSALLGPPWVGVPLFLVVFFALPPPFAFFFLAPLLFSVRPLCLLLSLVSGPGCPRPWRCVLFVLLASRFSALRALLPLFMLPVWPFAALWWLLPPLAPPPLVSRGFRCRRSVPCVFFFSSCPRPRCLRLSLVSAPGALGLGAVDLFSFFFGFPLLGSPCALACLCLLLGRWLPPPPPPLLCLAVFCAAARCLFFSFLLFPPPVCAPVVFGFLWFPAPRALDLGAVLCLLCSALRALPPRLSVPPGRRLLPGGCPPPPSDCVSRFSLPPLGVLFFFFFFLSCVVRPCCLWLPPVSGPGCPGPRRCALFTLLASWFSALRALLPLSCFPPGRWLLPGGCPPPLSLFLAVFVAAARCCVPCAVLCCVSLGTVLRRAAARCAARCNAVVCCVVLLRSFGAAACCAVPSGAARCPGGLCFAALCFAVFLRAVCSVLCVFCRGPVVCTVVRRSALCCVCPAVLCCAFPVLSALCGAVRCCAGAPALCCSCGACCCWRLLLCGAAVCCAVSFGVLWCGAGSGGPWLSAGGVFRCWCPCLAAWSASLWLMWFAVVPCFPVSCSVVLCCRVVLCCCALLSFCSAVGACFALLWPVVLCCVVLLVGCAVFYPVVVSACCGALSLVLYVPSVLRFVRCCATLCWL